MRFDAEVSFRRGILLAAARIPIICRQHEACGHMSADLLIDCACWCRMEAVQRETCYDLRPMHAAPGAPPVSSATGCCRHGCLDGRRAETNFGRGKWGENRT